MLLFTLLSAEMAIVAPALAAEGRVEGIVLFGDSPLPDVPVVLAGDHDVQAMTGPEGTFVIPAVPGTYALSVGGEGTAFTPVSVTLVEGQPVGLRITLDVNTGDATVTQVQAVAAAAADTWIRGTLYTASGQPLVGARVYISGLAAEASTDPKGAFEIAIPAGTWGVIAAAPGFGTRSVAVTTTVANAATVTLKLSPTAVPDTASSQRVDVVASPVNDGGAELLKERQDAVAVTDGIGAGQIARTGDSDAAGAARRVTGLTVIGGKYVYVRGLGDRYSATTLDGASLPSPEPERRVVPLDLFPTALIDSLVIQKTWTPDQSGEFSGGVVQIRSRRIPEAPVLSLSLSGAYASGTTFTTVQQGARGPTDWLGFGNASRALPDEVANSAGALKAAGRFSTDGYTADDLTAFGELFPNHWGLSDRLALPNLGVNFAIGNKFNVGGARVGALLGLAYGNAWDVEDGYENVYNSGADGLALSRETTYTEAKNTTRIGGMGSLGVEWGNAGDNVSSVTLLNHNSEAKATLYDTSEPSASGGTRNTAIDWQEQQLLSEQLQAQVTLGPIQVLPRYTFAVAGRLAPDHREYTYTQTDDGYAVSTIGSWNELRWETLSEASHDGGLSLRMPLRLGGGDGAVTAGAALSTRTRAGNTRRFMYGFRGTEGLDLTGSMEDLIVPENIGDDGDGSFLEIEEGTANSDDYTASQTVLAGFAMADIPWATRLRTLFGVRVEQSTQQVTTFETFDADLTPIATSLSTLDPLPVASVTLGVGPEGSTSSMQLRAGYSRTVSRPELRELSEVPFYEYRTGRLVVGNPELERAIIHNVDLRWEWYPSAGESVSVAMFGKQFEQPIESVIAVSAVSGSVSTLANAKSATNLGAEIDARKALIADFYVSGNVAVIASRVDLEGTDGNQTSSVRPLQGQSPYVANLVLGWDHAETKTVINAVYNVFGPRIVAVGTSGIPDTYEMPVHRVDLVVSQGFGKTFNVRLTAKNLLNWASRQKIGDQIASESREGWGVGVAVGAKL